MSITASARQIVPVRADLTAATAVLALIAARGAELNARLSSIHLFIKGGSIKHSAGSSRSRCDRPASRSKSP